MKKLKIDFQNFYLFSVPVDFDIAWLKIPFSNHLVVKLSFDDKVGIGEGVLYQCSFVKTLSLLKNEFQDFFKQEFSSFKQAREKILENFSSFPGLSCAFDLALWDLEGKLKKKSISQLLRRKPRNKIFVAEQIFIPKNKIYLIRELKKILAHKTKLIKLKAGRNLKEDLENIQLIEEVTNKKMEIQLDLNQGLTFDQALWWGRKISNYQISAWEEPISFKSFSQLNKLKKKIKIPIILDESIKNINDLKSAIKHKAIDILNLKINRLGGLTHSLQLIKLLEKHRLGVNIGCNEELGIGTALQIQLVKVLKNFRIMEALGSQRLGLDLIKEKQELKNGSLKTRLKRSGLGVTFDEAKLRRSAKKLNFPIITELNAQTFLTFYPDYLKTRLKGKLVNGPLFLKKTLRQAQSRLKR